MKRSTHTVILALMMVALLTTVTACADDIGRNAPKLFKLLPFLPFALGMIKGSAGLIAIVGAGLYTRSEPRDSASHFIGQVVAAVGGAWTAFFLFGLPMVTEEVCADGFFNQMMCGTSEAETYRVERFYVVEFAGFLGLAVGGVLLYRAIAFRAQGTTANE